jgi:polar amino acid transport system substrate-binding protein
MGLNKKCLNLLSMWMGTFIFATSILIPSNIVAKEKMIIGTSYKVLLSNPAQNGMLDLIAKEAFSRIGVEIELPYLPTERSISTANNGLHDGELNRIAGMEKIYPNLIRVDESMMDFEFVGLTKNISIHGGNWENLKPYQVGLIKGWKILETNVGNFSKITYYHSANDLFHGLELGRVDIILYGKLIGYAVMKDLNIDNVKVLTPAFATKKMYMYLHKKHRSKISNLAIVLKQMKQDGTYKKIKSQSLIPYQNVMNPDAK